MMIAATLLSCLNFFVELDVFDPPFAPLIIAEVEFPSIELANAFIPLEWFDEEVTNNPEYHNSVMSQKTFSHE